MNFDRQYRVSIGQAGSEGFEIGAEVPSPLHISFSLERADVETQNTGKLSIWNLNPEHLSQLEQKDCLVVVKAGYGNQLGIVFAGVITFFTTSMDGADRLTEIEVVDYRVEVRDTYVSLSYEGVVGVETVMEEIGGQMGVTVSYSYNAEFSKFQNGFSFVGAGKDALSKACDSSGLCWGIHNGVLQIKKTGDVMSNQVYVLSASTGMIGIPKRVLISNNDGSDGSSLGYDVVFLMNASIHVDDYVKVESAYLTGYFRVYSLQIEGDNLSGFWQCTARLLEVAG